MMRYVDKNRIHENTINHSALHASDVVVQVYVVSLDATPCVVVWLAVFGKPLFLGMLLSSLNCAAQAQSVSVGQNIERITPALLQGSPSQTPSLQEEDSNEIEEVIVTAVRPIPLIEIPKSASILDQDFIRTSPATTVPELLGGLPNVNTMSFDGNSKFTRIDIRGSGDTSVSNVLTLVNGFKINTPDLAGADYSILAISDVESIDLIRGANTVRYGSGASHGIINIITKTPELGLHFDASRKIGSYNKENIQARIAANSGSQGLSLNIVDNHSDGFRENNAITSRDLGLSGMFKLSKNNVLNVRYLKHEDNYALPGPIAIDDFQAEGLNFRSQTPGSSQGATNDQLIMATLQGRLFSFLKYELAHQDRQRKNPFRFSGSNDDNENILTLDSQSSNATFHFDFYDERISFSTGVQLEKAKYFRTSGGVMPADATALIHDTQKSTGYFYELNLKPKDNVKLTFGYRKNTTENIYVRDEFEAIIGPLCETETIIGPTGFIFDSYIISTCPLKVNKDIVLDQWTNEAFEFGLTVDLTEHITSFYSSSSTFRTPNADEFGVRPDDDFAGGLLRPQTARRSQLGIRYRFPADAPKSSAMISSNLTFFKSRVEDEILFIGYGVGEIDLTGFNGSLLIGENFNFPIHINRRGAEFELAIRPLDGLLIAFGAGYVDATTLQDKRLPLVPKTNLSANIRWKAPSNTHFTLNWDFVNERVDGNDFGNSNFTHFPAFEVSSANILQTFEFCHCELAISVQNIFDKAFISTGYSGEVYPGAGRRYTVTFGVNR